jgi:hypothetical protein
MRPAPRGVTGVEVEEVEEVEASLPPSWAEAGAAARASTERWWRRPPHAAAAAALVVVVPPMPLLLLLLLHAGRARHGLMDPVPSATRRLGAHGARPPPARTFICLFLVVVGLVLWLLLFARARREKGRRWDGACFWRGGCRSIGRAR